MDSGFCPETKLLLNFDLNPQSLTVEPVLVSLVVASHGEKALIRIFVRSAPGVVNAHRVVGRDRSVEKAPSFAACIFATQLLKNLLDIPELQDRVFTSNKIAVGDGLKHMARKPKCA